MPATDEGAVFAPTRVRSARRPRIVASVVTLAVVGLIAFGVLDRASAPNPASVTALTAAPLATARAQTARSSRPPPRASLEVPGNNHDGPIDSLFQLDVRPSGNDVFIHGDVFSLSVARVSVTLEDPAGHAEATTAVDVPGGSTAFRLGAVSRFDVHFRLTNELGGGGFVVSATALNGHGRELATLSEWVARSADTATIVIGEIQPIQLEATRHPSTITVHTDLLVQQVTRVLVWLESLDGQIASSASVNIPAAIGDGRDHRPPLAFNVELAVPTGLATGVVVVRAQAYDSENRLVASTRVWLAAEM